MPTTKKQKAVITVTDSSDGCVTVKLDFVPALENSGAPVPSCVQAAVEMIKLMTAKNQSRIKSVKRRRD